MSVISLGQTHNQVNLKRAILEMTSTCNLHCVHCSRDSESAKYDGEMSDDQWFILTEELYDYGIDMLVLGGGEPLLKKKRVMGIVERGARRGKATRITTNGLLLTNDMASFFADNGGIVSYGMDGFDEEAYESFRGKKGSYKALRKAVDLGLKYEILDVLAVTATRINLDQVEKVIDFCAEIGITCVVSKYVPTGRPNYNELLLTPEEREAMLGLVAAKRKQHPHILITTTREPLEGIVLGTGAMGVLGCIAGSGWCLITAAGDVCPCPYFPLVVGNVTEDSFFKVWEFSPHLRALRNRSSLDGKCGHCSEKENCGGCRALAYAMTGDYLSEDPQCWLSEPRQKQVIPGATLGPGTFYTE